MAVKLRLSRGGTKKRPYYYIVATNSTSPRDCYIRWSAPSTRSSRMTPGAEARRRTRHWLMVGAQPTDRVMRFLDAAGIAKRTPSKNPEKAKPKAQGAPPPRLAKRAPDTPAHPEKCEAVSDEVRELD